MVLFIIHNSYIIDCVDRMFGFELSFEGLSQAHNWWLKFFENSNLLTHCNISCGKEALLQCPPKQLTNHQTISDPINQL